MYIELVAFRQLEIRVCTAEALVPEYSSFSIETAVEKFKSYKSTCNDLIGRQT
jgi:hypothetical protein